MRQSGKWAFVIQVDLPPNVRSLFRSRRGRRHIPGTRYTLTWSIHHEHVFVLSAYDSTSEPQHTGTFFLQWIELTMLDHMSPDEIKPPSVFVRPRVAPHPPDLYMGLLYLTEKLFCTTKFWCEYGCPQAGNRKVEARSV